MSKQKIKTIAVESGVSSNFLEETLTQDITPLASLFDLIDNSIDAARDHLLQTKHSLDEYGLPSDYSEYAIHIRIDKNSIRILDNGLGIEEDVLSKKAFHIADPSNHAFGIGHYGLGLKRSLLKFGSNYAMSTDTGEVAFTMRFNNKNFGGQSSETLTADQYPTGGKRKALFSVSDLKSSVKYEIKEESWFKNAINQLSIRYALYVSKGLKIVVHSVLHKEFRRISGSIPTLRTDTKISIRKPPPCNIDGVDVFIDAGIHQNHFFTEEKNYSLSNNRAITSEFGLYFICNDRVIVAASSSSEHGWKTNKWHSEYNGFVCLVRFVSEDSKKMPWNTAKTALKTDSTLFLKIKEKIQPVADFYRGEIKKKYPSKKKMESTTKPEPTKEASNQKNTSETITSAQAKPHSKANNNRQLHVKNWTTLLPKTFPHSDKDEDVLNSYVIEAIDLKIIDAPYAAAMLYRSLLEAALKRFVIKTRRYQDVKDHYYSRGEGKKKNHSAEYMENQDITLAMIFAWLVDSSHLFDAELRATLLLSTKKAKEYAQYLNGVVHCKQRLNANKLIEIRNDTYELLKFAITKDLLRDKN